jgi:quercetin dioxygenase-like cupin family protein
MSYASKIGQTNSTLVLNGQSNVLNLAGGVVVHLIARGQHTDERFGLFRWDMPANAGGPAPHFHKTFSESFYILSGQVDIWDGKDWAKAKEGDFFLVPDGSIHAFKNDSDKPASMLIIFAPGPPREKYFEEMAAITKSGKKLSPEEWTQFYARHDQYMVQ